MLKLIILLWNNLYVCSIESHGNDIVNILDLPLLICYWLFCLHCNMTSAVKCPEIPQLPHGFAKSKETNHFYEMTIHYSCDVGFTATDNSSDITITCLADGIWSPFTNGCEGECWSHCWIVILLTLFLNIFKWSNCSYCS